MMGPMKITCETPKGGAVEISKPHGVWASYAVATVGKAPPAEILYAGATLKDGRRVQFFLNRETSLVVVDVIAADDTGGVEILRKKV